MTRRFGTQPSLAERKFNTFQFYGDKKHTENPSWIASEHFNIYRDEKHILAYNLSFKKCHIGLDLLKPSSEPKNNTFQFYEDEKH